MTNTDKQINDLVNAEKENCAGKTERQILEYLNEKYPEVSRYIKTEALVLLHDPIDLGSYLDSCFK